MAEFNTPEEILKLAEPNAEFTELLQASPPPKLDFSNALVQAIRQQSLAAEQKRTAEAIAAGRVEEVRTVTMRDGFSSDIRIHRPKADAVNRGPLVVLIHGGGFVFGNPLQMGRTARVLTDLFGATVVAMSYRLAPEHPWPQSHNDAWDTLVWIAENAAIIGADTGAGFVVGGASAGANISAVLTQRSLKESLAAPITGMWLNVPMVFKDIENVPDQYKPFYLSHAQNADAPGLLSRSALNYIRSAVKGDGYSPMFSPINAEHPHAGMPPIFIQAAGMDIVRDDAIVYEKMLRAKGVSTTLKIYPGVPHGHETLWPSLQISHEASIDGIEGIGKLLGRAIDRETVRLELGFSKE